MTTQTPLPLLAKSSPPTPTSMFMYIITSSLTIGLALSPPKYLPDIIGSIFATLSVVTWPTVNRWDCHCAQPYYKIMKRKDPMYLLVMANGSINPKSGFPFTYDEDPFISYHKKNEFKVGNIHLRCEVVQRARLGPSFIRSKKGNSDPPKTASWPQKNVWSSYRTIQSTMTRIASTLLIPYWNCFNLFHSLTKNNVSLTTNHGISYNSSQATNHWTTYNSSHIYRCHLLYKLLQIHFFG